jgi:broad specificity phosphatase PhoE
MATGGRHPLPTLSAPRSNLCRQALEAGGGEAARGDEVSDTVYLVRHGDVVGSESRRFIGHLDVPLSARGERQLQALAARLERAGLHAVYSSDLVRSRHSAEILAGPHALAPRPLPALREFAMGEWDGLTADEVRARDRIAFDAWMSRVGEFQFPGGENLAQVAERAWPAFERIVAAHAGPIAIVAHGGTNRAILCRALGIALPRILAIGQDYGAMSLLARTRAGWRLELLNHTEPVT